jgi:IAA-amino acid hydrolase
VKFVFQPAEEGYAGAFHVLKEGVLDDVSAIFGLHVDPTLPVGAVASRPGPFLAGAGRFLVTVTGKGGHAAGPQDAVDPIVAASSAIVNLQLLVAREIDPLEGAVCDYLTMFAFYICLCRYSNFILLRAQYVLTLFGNECMS